MERGEFITCKAPYGYRIKDGKNLEIHEKEAAIIRLIFTPVEVLPLLHPGACQALVSVDIHQLPALVMADLLGVLADLAGGGMKLIGLFGK